MIQRSEEWWSAKIGNVGASHIADIMAKGKGATRNNYMTSLILEKITGKHVENCCGILTNQRMTCHDSAVRIELCGGIVVVTGSEVNISADAILLSPDHKGDL